ncbi:class III lanthionine synthetase LanKC [Streptomyces sp. CB01881]|uniref:class III lanthionine synthetase LanKC n=1 Tax=Streptomyces sp. CB01881 TaxID=2078691 RepID=UPI00138754E9|nr:class III lanthionine synthetase LanKC [Streptomyces sp. CB01881]
MRPADYGQFCETDPVFYDQPGSGDDAADLYPPATRPVPEGWERSRDTVWVYLHPEGTTLPDQGWKVHVSGSLDEAPEIIETVLEFCRTERISAKFLAGRETVLKANSKYAPRGSSGKLLTLYPRDPDELRRLLDGLTPLLAGRQGPYILSDLRWRESLLYLRYGAFRQLYCLDEQGRTVSALRDATGTLVPDLRRPVFSVPEWVEIPDFLAEQIAARGRQAAPEDFPYDIERALHFSNGGGVYKARDRRDGRTVVLREARPLAGLDQHGADAVQRLHREADMLRRLAGLDFVPQLFDHLKVWEHEYLVEEFIDGEKLERYLFTGRHPLLRAEPTEAALAEYAATALDFAGQLTAMLRTLHGHGVAFGDLHPGNVMVRPDGRLALVDFELAFDLDGGTPPGFGAPGFISPAARTGKSIDDYALACMRLFLFLPLTFLIELDSGKAAQLAEAAADRFGLPAGWAAELVRDLSAATGGTLPPGAAERTGVGGGTGSSAGTSPGRPLPVPTTPADRRRVMDELAEGILAAATPARTDRLYPGDPEQFNRAGIDLAHGASGVIHALATVGYPVPKEHVDWLLRAARDPKVVRPGLYDGLHGAALALDQVGCEAEAMDVLARARKLTGHRRQLGVFGADLAGGLAGIGLNLLHFADRHADPGLAEEALAIGEEFAAPGGPPLGKGRVGLLHGGSGVALFLVRLYEHTGQERWLDLAEGALARDLASTRLDEKGLLLTQDNQSTAYLGSGSAGAVIAVRALLRHRPDPRFAEAAEQLDRACAAEFFLMPGLFEGRAGLICALATGDSPHLDHQVDRLSWHLVRHQDRVAVPGQQLYRLSTDLATGAAGVLLALHAASTRKGVSALPLLDHRGTPSSR